MIEIREEGPDDVAAVRALNGRAFGQDLEGDPRFAFTPASSHGIVCEWEVPDDVFLLLVLDEARMQGVSGLARYRPEFSSVF